MPLNEMIYKRKSCRSFTNVPADWAMIETIKAFPMKPLYPEIKVHWDNIHVYCHRKGSRLDAGIALAHLYVANEETYRFFKAENVPAVSGYSYIGNVTL